MQRCQTQNTLNHRDSEWNKYIGAKIQCYALLYKEKKESGVLALRNRRGEKTKNKKYRKEPVRTAVVCTFLFLKFLTASSALLKNQN